MRGRLIEKAVKVAEEEASRLAALEAEARRLLRAAEREGLIHYLDRAPPAPARTAGVDGFFAEAASLLGRRVYAYRVVGVVAYAGGGARVVEEVEDLVVAGEAGGEEVAEYVEYTMMRAEAETAARLSREAPVVLDGPIVDPPHEPYTPMASTAHSRYHEWRAGLLAGRRVAGYVKRVRGGRLAELLGVRLPGGPLGDPELAYITLRAALRLHSDAHAAWIGPITPPDTPPYTSYKGLTQSYVLTRWWRSVRGVEAWDAEWGVELVVSATPPGLPHPVPVQLAHEEAGRLADGLDAVGKAIVSRIIERRPASPAVLMSLKTGG